MADIVITVASVVPGTGAAYVTGIAGAAILQGQTVYLDSTTNTVKLAKANTTVLTAAVVGIAVDAALTGQAVTYQTAGNLAFGAILTAGRVYVCSGTAAGGICLANDLTTGWWCSILGIASTTSNLVLGIQNSGLVG